MACRRLPTAPVRCLSAARPAPPPASRLMRNKASRVLRPERVPQSANLIACLPQRRTYYSYDHPTDLNPFSETEQALLSAAYAHVPEHGFSQQALAHGARDAGYLDISPSILSDGPFALIRWHLVTQRLALAERRKELFDTDNDPKDVDRRIQALAWARLRSNEPVVRRWQEALAIMAQPSYVPTCVKELALLADEILFLAGDTSVDPSWYTKRATLSTIYASCELYMTNDRSEAFHETQAFLSRRLQEAQSLGGVVSSVRQWVGFTAQAGINVLRSKGVRI